ncbi:MAG: DUF7520 family protein [Halobacteriota archaeon]
MRSRSLSGHRLILALYVGIVAFAGVMGYLLPFVVAEITPPRLFFLVELPATPIGLAVYGVVTIGAVLGVLLWLVTYVSEHVDEADPGR